MDCGSCFNNIAYVLNLANVGTGQPVCMNPDTGLPLRNTHTPREGWTEPDLSNTDDPAYQNLLDNYCHDKYSHLVCEPPSEQINKSLCCGSSPVDCVGVFVSPEIYQNCQITEFLNSEGHSLAPDSVTDFRLTGNDGLAYQQEPNRCHNVKAQCTKK